MSVEIRVALLLLQVASDSEEDMSQDEDEAEQVSRSSKLPQHKVNMKMVNDWTTKIQV